MVRILVGANARVNYRPETCFPALVLSAFYGHVEIVTYLLDEAAALARGHDEYLAKCTSAPSDACKALEKKTFEADWKELFARGEWNHVPLLIGTVQDEGATFIYAGVTTWLPEALHPLIMDAIFFDDGPKVVDFYKPVAAA